MMIQRLRVVAALAVSALLVGSLAPPVRGQEPEPLDLGSEIRDSAKMFKPETVRKVKEEIDRINAETNVSIRIETVESVGDKPVRVAAMEYVRKWASEWPNALGIYILMDKADHKFEILRTGTLNGIIQVADTLAFRDTFLNEFRRGQFDEGLLAGVHTIGERLIGLKHDGKLPRSGALQRLEDGSSRSSERSGTPSTDLVLKNQVRLTLPGARLLIAGAEAKAAELKLKVNVAVVDDGGHLLSFDRMDGARPASGYTAITKATSAATFRAETGPLPKGSPSPDPLLNLSLQNAAAASGGKLTTLLGGVPVIVDGQVIGAVGVGGGTGEQDAEVAKAGIAWFLSEIAPEPKSEK